MAAQIRADEAARLTGEASKGSEVGKGGDGGGKAVSMLDWQPPAPGYRRYLLISNLFSWLAVAAIIGLSLGFSAFDDRLVLAGLLAPLVIGAGTIAYQWAAARARAHALSEQALFYRSGLWWRRETAIPFSRIQHVARAQGPVERAFDLASLQVYTAGAAQADLTIPGLATADSRMLEEALLARADRERVSSSSQGKVA